MSVNDVSVDVLRATFDDSKDVFAWRNDLQTRKMFASTDEVAWERHSVWFNEFLASDNGYMYVGVLGNTKVGMCRFDVVNGIAELSINLNPKMRGKHLSDKLLSSAMAAFLAHHELTLLARIKKQNIGSIKCFRKCGFVFERSDEMYDYYIFK